MGENVDFSPDDLPIMIELCDLCETAWPPGTLTKAIRIDVTEEIKICPDCVEELTLKERKMANITNKKRRTKKS